MMLTSGGCDGDVERYRTLGIESYVTKPVRETELLSEITHILNGAKPQVDQRRVLIDQPTELYQPRSAHILLVEDNPVNQKYAQALLKKWGHRVTVACNGLEAVEAVLRTRFDLVLMDLQMPELGGCEATVAIRQKHDYAEIPIIAMTAHAMQEDREACFRVGMNDFISKPVRPQTLAAVLARWLPTPRPLELQLPVP
jgi:two-component system sensor histidine kinase/response regulator